MKNSLIEYLVSVSRKNASTNLVALRRSASHKYIYQKMVEYNINDIRFGEFIQEFLTLISSKVHYFEKIPFNCRDLTFIYKNGLLQASESSDGRHVYLEQYISDGIYGESLDKAVNCLSDEIMRTQNDLSSKEKVEDIIRDTLTSCLCNRSFFQDNHINLFIINRPYISKIILICWHVAKKILHIVHKENPAEIVAELQLVRKIILITRHMHDMDTPIELSPFKMNK